jgi:hypothetical protein
MPRRKPANDDDDQERLDRALIDTFPASDPVSFLQPSPMSDADAAEPQDTAAGKPGLRRRKPARPAPARRKKK